MANTEKLESDKSLVSVKNNFFNFKPNSNFFAQCNYYIIFIFILDIPFKIKKNSSEIYEICSICLQSIVFPAQINSCGHKFCYHCINHWSKIHRICPLCRIPFTKVTNEPKKTNLVIIGNKSKDKDENKFTNNNKCPQSHKLPCLFICSICGKYGSTSSIFTCQICKKFHTHYWCEKSENFRLGIYICTLCMSLRNNRLNEI
jgi:hypothetical protein